ncbi:hypothetical protein [Streptomyces albogriseolus]|uniref:hypothetical protein n=1 Tax=Streptomyces albogriseolus TaxID=1887 RepID=UPI003460A92C
MTSSGAGFTAREQDVRYVYTSPAGSTVPYSTQGEADAAVETGGGSWTKMDTSSGRILD